MPETITVTIEMTEEEAEGLVYVTSADHPGILSLTRKLRTHALRHPAITARHQAQRDEAVANHEAMLSRTASTGLVYASCACGWRSRDYRALTNAENALATHRRKAGAEEDYADDCTSDENCDHPTHYTGCPQS